jgi:hypothetical protein
MRGSITKAIQKITGLSVLEIEEITGQLCTAL